ncbi:MAG TPA: hypothetical protein VG328_03190 [Stellaceae bacterium]|nr:hypothetical protein [Stellaceae bacterium]
MSEAQRLRDKAFHAREVALALTDKHACAALEALADEFEAQATELERREQGARGEQNKPASQRDTP